MASIIGASVKHDTLTGTVVGWIKQDRAQPPDKWLVSVKVPFVKGYEGPQILNFRPADLTFSAVDPTDVVAPFEKPTFTAGSAVPTLPDAIDL
jgi:hypothetical protein